MKEILECTRQWSDEKINKEAVKFLEAHPLYSRIPVEIEKIVDNDLQIDIIPLDGLRKLFEGSMDGFISSDFTEIRVDSFISENRDSRYRFSLAHEMGHMVLHREVYSLLDLSSLSAAINTILTMPPAIRNLLDDQADEFAGRVLVPRRELKYLFGKEHDRARERVLEEIPGLDTFDRLDYQKAVEDVLIYSLAEIFKVSSAAMRIRLRKEGLIPISE